jgi:uncharacterized protein
MAIDRRRFVALLAAGPMVGAMVGPLRAVHAAGGLSYLVGCRSSADGRHAATLFDTGGRVLMDVALPARGHGIAVNHRGDTAVVLARRPGDFMVVIDLVGRRVLQRLRTPADRHLFGHAVFSPDDRLLLTTENDFERGEGRIALYAADDGFRRVDEYASHGIGPHELALLPGGDVLVVANGGILTHPDMPRAKLNLDDMRSTLSYLQLSDGRLLADYPAPSQRLSIRHLAVAADGRVACVTQYEGPGQDRPPLIALHVPGSDPTWLTAPAPIQAAMRNYCGSVAFDIEGRHFAVSSPRGGLVTHWSANGDYVGKTRQADVCGIAPARYGLWFSDGHGGLRQAAEGSRRTFEDTRWDNHLAAWMGPTAPAS